MRLIDLDEYRPGPFTVESDRLPGSTRYMAPEELVHGARVDERTTVFHLGRTAAQLLTDPNLSSAQSDVVEAATGIDPATRYPRSEEHTSELQSLMRISYAVFCLKKKKQTQQNNTTAPNN